MWKTIVSQVSVSYNHTNVCYQHWDLEEQGGIMQHQSQFHEFMTQVVM